MTHDGKMELPNQERIRTFEDKKMYKYLGILAADTIKVEIKDRFLKRYLRGMRKLLRNQDI